jgi:hypothetical protein
VTRVSVVFEWAAVGEVSLDGRPVFPALPASPGLYRFSFEAAGVAPSIYIGESDDLRRRLYNYRMPGASQRTNVRMHEELIVAIANGSRVSLATIGAATITLDDGPSRLLDLTRKTSRLIVENAAIAAVIAEREADPDHGPREPARRRRSRMVVIYGP